MTSSQDDRFDYDQIIIGTGFGGSVSALRLSEKGHRVLMLEKGRRWKDEEFSDNSWNLKKFLWAPRLGLTGNLQISLTRKITALHGVGVGGGSLVYANVHLIPKDEVFAAESWTRVHHDWKDRLMPYYGLAQRMLGVTKSHYENAADHALKETARRMGREATYQTVNTGVLFPEDPADGSGAGRGDPYFSGDGPTRNSCRYCGGCTMGCRHNAKNTLVKNYLWFAERNGVEIRAESEVTRIEPLANDRGERDGSAGYEITVQSSTARFAKKPLSTEVPRTGAIRRGVRHHPPAAQGQGSGQDTPPAIVAAGTGGAHQFRDPYRQHRPVCRWAGPAPGNLPWPDHHLDVRP